MSVKLREKSLADGRTSLYLDVYHNRKRTYEFLNLYLTRENKGGKNRETRQLAERIRAKREYELLEHKHGYASERRGSEDFLRYFGVQALRRTPSTRRLWLITEQHIRAYAGDTILFEGITREWIEGWRAYLLKNVGPNTAAMYFNIVKTALRAAERDEIIATNPATKVEAIRQEETQRTFLTEEELSTLAATPCRLPMVKSAFLFACATGLRHSDIVALTWQSLRDGTVEFRQTKTKAVEYLPLSAAARVFLPAPGSGNARVFELPDRIATVETALRRWAAAAGITKHLTFHVSRHTFATRLLTAGADIYTVSKLLGHKKLATTQIYAKVVDEKKRAAVDLLPVYESS